MASLMRIDQATATDAIGDLERRLDGDRCRLDEAARALEAHRQIHARAAEQARAPERKARFNGLSIVERSSPRPEAKHALRIVPRRPALAALSAVRPHPYSDFHHEEDDTPLPPLVA
jgi:hypothetical protein